MLRRISSGAVLAAAIVAQAGAQSASPAFSDQTATAGIGVIQIPGGYSAASRMLAGGAVGDFNRDGWQDLYVIVGGTDPDRLYINNGDGTFTDEAAAWGITGTRRSSGVAVGDYDNDGWLDIYVTCHGTTGWGPNENVLWRNNGDNTFTNTAAAAGVKTTSPITGDGFGAAFGDYDLDGDLDLAVTAWFTNSQGNRLFRNNGDGTFTDVTTSAILYDMTPVRGFSPRFVDMDGDRYPELLWVGDFFTSKYLRNDANGKFTEMTAAAGVGLDSNGMGNTVGDYDNDGDLDWYVSSILEDGSTFRFGNMLYMNQGGHSYVESGQSAGVDDGGWGWGVTSVDMNHDGLLDIVEVNGWQTGTEWLTELARLYMNNGDGTFTDEALASGFTHNGQGRGLVNMDYDNDGDQDLVVFCPQESVGLYRNDVSGPDANWIRIFFDTSAHADIAPDGFQTGVTITTGGQSQYRYMDGGCTYLATAELSVHAGLGAAATIDEILVEWPNGRINRLRNVAANQTITIEPCLLDGDADGDGAVNFDDLNLILANWGNAVEAWRNGDANGDGAVDFDDINLSLGAWGQTCP
ncbi:MAG: FG-GAP-like repeat-containing protein [Phycisphaerales bacterium]